MSNFHRTSLALLGLILVAPAQAAEPGDETVSVRVARPASDTPADMRRLRRHVADAALEACGASPFSALGMKDAIVRSPCWRQSYAAGLAQAGDTEIVPASRPTQAGAP